MSTADLISAGDKTILLRDGRTPGYAEYGAPEGPALFYFHGHPGARQEAGFLAGPAAQAGVRLIGIDRPGMGLSTFQAGRRILDWPADVVELADSLSLDLASLALAARGDCPATRPLSGHLLPG